MKKTLCRCIKFIHEKWKIDIRLYTENEKLYVRVYEKFYDQQSKITIEFGDVEPGNVSKAYEYIKNKI